MSSIGQQRIVEILIPGSYVQVRERIAQKICVRRDAYSVSYTEENRAWSALSKLSPPKYPFEHSARSNLVQALV